MAEDANKGISRDVVADLTDDVLVDILSRLPIKSLCRCELVSKRWLNLITHPEHRKKLPQTLIGFFYTRVTTKTTSRSRLAISPPSQQEQKTLSLSFLPEYKSIHIKDGYNGLLLCHCWKPTDPVAMDSVVCNPATEKWIVVPDSGWSSKVKFTRLGFDPAVSSHLHVFEFIPDNIWYIDDGEIDPDGRIKVVAVYSSKTGVWSLEEIDYEQLLFGEYEIPTDSNSVFFNGVLHVTTSYQRVQAINVEGEFVNAIDLPIPLSYDNGPDGDIFLSQGHLYLTAGFIPDGSDDYQLSVWVHEDYDNEDWILKYRVDPWDLFGELCYLEFGNVFSIISIHPEHDLIFMVCGEYNTLMSCEMGHMKLRFIDQLGRSCLGSLERSLFIPCDPVPYWSIPYIPYVPLFLELMADDEQ